jgi:hypothetical protein
MGLEIAARRLAKAVAGLQRPCKCKGTEFVPSALERSAGGLGLTKDVRGVPFAYDRSSFCIAFIYFSKTSRFMEK